MIYTKFDVSRHPSYYHSVTAKVQLPSREPYIRRLWYNTRWDDARPRKCLNITDYIHRLLNKEARRAKGTTPPTHDFNFFIPPIFFCFRFCARKVPEKIRMEWNAEFHRTCFPNTTVAKLNRDNHLYVNDERITNSSDAIKGLVEWSRQECAWLTENAVATTVSPPPLLPCTAYHADTTVQTRVPEVRVAEVREALDDIIGVPRDYGNGVPDAQLRDAVLRCGRPLVALWKRDHCDAKWERVKHVLGLDHFLDGKTANDMHAVMFGARQRPPLSERNVRVVLNSNKHVMFGTDESTVRAVRSVAIAIAVLCADKDGGGSQIAKCFIDAQMKVLNDHRRSPSSSSSGGGAPEKSDDGEHSDDAHPTFPAAP